MFFTFKLKHKVTCYQAGNNSQQKYKNINLTI